MQALLDREIIKKYLTDKNEKITTNNYCQRYRQGN